MSALVPPFRVTLELLGANNRQGRAACNRRHTLLMKARRTTLARYNYNTDNFFLQGFRAVKMEN